MRVKKWKKRQIIRVSFIIVAFFVIAKLIPFLMANRFRPFSFVYYYYGYCYENEEPFRDFKDHRKNFEVVVGEVNSFISNTPGFWEEYSSIVYSDKTGLVFTKQGEGFNYERVVVPASVDEWETVRSCLSSFPNPGYAMLAKEEYPGYVVYSSETSPSRYVYTGGEFPKEFIDDLWADDPKFVAVLKLAHGWYEYRKYYY